MAFACDGQRMHSVYPEYATLQFATGRGSRLTQQTDPAPYFYRRLKTCTGKCTHESIRLIGKRCNAGLLDASNNLKSFVRVVVAAVFQTYSMGLRILAGRRRARRCVVNLKTENSGSHGSACFDQ